MPSVELNISNRSSVKRNEWIKHSVIIMLIFSGIVGVIGLLIIFLNLAAGLDVVSEGLLICGYVLLGVSVVTPTVGGVVCVCESICSSNQDTIDERSESNIEIENTKTDVIEMKDITGLT